MSQTTKEDRIASARAEREKREEIRNSLCAERAGKLIALLEAASDLADELWKDEKKCDCAFHDAEYAAANGEVYGDCFYPELKAIGGTCWMFANAIRTDGFFVIDHWKLTANFTLPQPNQQAEEPAQPQHPTAVAAVQS
jgi:hypothetical protein